MKSLQNADAHHLMAAIGWLELGNHIEANAELEKIIPAARAHPDVLEVRWQIYSTEQKWEECLDIANAILTLDFNHVHGWIHKAVSLHQLGRTQEAYEHLKNSPEMFPENWMIRYNLARLACHLKRKRDAWQWLEQAINLGNCKQLKLMALDDPELEPLWVEIVEI